MSAVHAHASPSRRLVPVDAGPLPAMIALRTSLECVGLPCLVEGEALKTWHPFVTGGSIFGTRLLAPVEQAAEVREAIADLKQAAARSLEMTDDNGDQQEIVESLGLRIRWSFILGITAPIGLWYAFSYVSLATKLPSRPRSHFLVICAIILCLIHSMALVVFAVFAATRI